MTHKGYYSLIQYCPDRSRLESVNIGVLLFCPELLFLDTRISKDNDRVLRFFGEQNLEYINLSKQSIYSRLKGEGFKTKGDLDRFISTRANDIILSDLRSTKVVDPNSDLNHLYDELVA